MRKLWLFVVVAVLLLAKPGMVLAQDEGGTPVDLWAALKDPTALRGIILTPAGLGIVGGLSSLILREIPAFVNMTDPKKKKLISAGTIVGMALILYGITFIPPQIWIQLRFLWYALLLLAIVYFGQKVTYRGFVEAGQFRALELIKDELQTGEEEVIHTD